MTNMTKLEKILIAISGFASKDVEEVTSSNTYSHGSGATGAKSYWVKAKNPEYTGEKRSAIKALFGPPLAPKFLNRYISTAELLEYFIEHHNYF